MAFPVSFMLFRGIMGIIHSHNLYSSIISSVLTVGFGDQWDWRGLQLLLAGHWVPLAGRLTKLDLQGNNPAYWLCLGRCNVSHL